MDKLLLTIEVPSVEQIFDFTAPKTITPGLMRELLYQVLAELTGGAYIPSGAELLCRRDLGELTARTTLPTEVSLEDSGVQMGDHLILF